MNLTGTVIDVPVGHGTVSSLPLIAVILFFLSCFGLGLSFYNKYGTEVDVGKLDFGIFQLKKIS